MPMQPFNPDATTRQELGESRSPRFIALQILVTKGHFASRQLTPEEREIVSQFDALDRDLARKEIDEPAIERPW